jgi:hypothetical protein
MPQPVPVQPDPPPDTGVLAGAGGHALAAGDTRDASGSADAGNALAPDIPVLGIPVLGIEVAAAELAPHGAAACLGLPVAAAATGTELSDAKPALADSAWRGSGWRDSPSSVSLLRSHPAARASSATLLTPIATYTSFRSLVTTPAISRTVATATRNALNRITHDLPASLAATSP